MPIARREAEIFGERPLATGTIDGSAPGQLTVTLRTEPPDGKTGPEQLIACAHHPHYGMIALVPGENQPSLEQTAPSH